MTLDKTKPAPVYDVAPDKGGFAVRRNERYLMTPVGSAYIVPTQALAEAIAEEWRAQTDKIDPTKMPMTQLTATAIDIVGKDRDKTIGGLVAYVGSELLCHRAEGPKSLCDKQQELWQPLLDWAKQKFGLSLCSGLGLMPIKQPDTAPEMIRTALEAYDNLLLAGLSSAVDSSGSLILGLALLEGERTAEEVFQAAELDAAHQAKVWGEDPVTLARQASVRGDLEACATWFALLKK